MDVLADDERLLFEPSKTPESLLGRPILLAPDGTWTIADALAGGCEVMITREQNETTSRYFEDVGRLTSVGIGLPDVVRLQSEFSKSAKVELEIHHTEFLKAEMRGTCGEKVITRVKVGTGRRSSLRERQRGVGATAAVVDMPVEGRIESWERVGGSKEWSTPHAWAFAVGAGTTSADDLKIIMAPDIHAGQPFKPMIEANRDMWLLVLFQDANGDYGVVFPPADPTVPLLRVKGGTRKVLPPVESEAPQGRETETLNETLLVFGFPNEGDFKACLPPSGALTPAQENDYVKALQVKLKTLPINRWATTTFNYTRHPAQ